jgi:hypothetical protein
MHLNNLYDNNGSEESVQQLLKWAQMYITSFVRVFNHDVEDMIRRHTDIVRDNQTN